MDSKSLLTKGPMPLCQAAVARLAKLPCSARAGFGSLDTSKQIIGSTYLSVFGHTKTDVLATISGNQNTKDTVLAGLTFLRILISTCGEKLSSARKIALIRFNETGIRSWVNLTL